MDSALAAVHALWNDVANALIETVNDMYPSDSNSSPDFVSAVSKKQRYMYLSLTFLAFLMVAQLLEHV